MLITVDNGISSWEEVEYAKSQGIDTVVTDHHEPPERLPDAVAVVDPHRKDSTGNGRELCGAGVAFMLILALEGPDADQEAVLEDFGDLAAIGTIAVSYTHLDVYKRQFTGEYNASNRFGCF